mgnify:CR=1 FL=1
MLLTCPIKQYCKVILTNDIFVAVLWTIALMINIISRGTVWVMYFMAYYANASLNGMEYQISIQGRIFCMV